MQGKRLLRIKAHPGERENRVEAVGKDAYEVWVRAPAEQGRANAAVLALLSRRPELAGRGLRIIKGAHSKSKIVVVMGEDASNDPRG